MNIQKINIQKLNPAEYNPRKNLTTEDEEYKKIKRSLTEFGYVDPVIVNSDMTVIGGHQRLKVLKELGYTEIECNVIDLDKNKEKALNLALNKISGEWDNNKLEELLAELKETDIDIDITGFDFDEVDDILKDVVGSKEDDFDIDKALDEIEEPITKRGDLWILGRHKLLCGDSTIKKNVDLLVRLIKNSSKENDVALDLFGGSGSTLIASEQTNRVCYMMELDEKYCDVIIKRWETLTNKKAKLECNIIGGQ